ncbi:MAG TPA: FAD-dependent oxidoreductase [Ilumatobacteraceae bacterium]
MRVVVVGAGLSGIIAASELTAAGHDVIALERGRSPGGRLATRRIGAATLDHGAQFFTIRSDAFAAIVEPYLTSGLVYEWCRGFTDGGDGYPRYAVHGGMNALAKSLAADVDVRCNSFVFVIRRGGVGAPAWEVGLDDGTSVAADALVLTCPTPQSSALLLSAEVVLPAELRAADYDRTLAVLLTLDRASTMAAPGGLQNPNDVMSFITDNQRKGISTTPALTVHANAAWSQAHWNDDPAMIIAALAAAAAPFTGAATIVEAQLKKWRFATPRSIWPEPCWVAADAPVVVAGDAFAGPKIEGAALSGLAAAAAISSL